MIRPVLRIRFTDRKQIFPNGRASTVTDVLTRHCKWQTLFSWRGDASKRIVNKFRKPGILQLNIEGLTASKMNVLYHVAAQREALVILLQETYCTSTQKLVLPDYELAGFSLSRKHGLATFVHERLKWTFFNESPPTSETEWLCIDIDGYKIVNVYKPPPIRLQVFDVPVLQVVLGYDANTANGEWLVGWVNSNNLAFVSIDSDSRLPDRQILEKFPRSQHSPSLITPPRFARPVPSKSVKRRNFVNAK